MANQLLTIGMITRETTRLLVNNLTFTKKINREYSDEFAKTGAKIGSVLNVRKPVRFTRTTGQGLQIQDVVENSVPVALTTQYQKAFVFSTSDLALNIDDFSKRFVRTAVASMANDIDYDGLGLFSTIYNEIGTPGTVPATALLYLQAAQRLNEEAAPMDERKACISPAMNATIVNALSGLFNPQVRISDQYEKGLMSKDTLGLDWYMDQNVRTQKVGPLGGSPQVSGNNQTGSTLVTKGWTAAAASRLNLGDVFTIANVNAVNPQNLQSTGALRQFVVTAPFSSDSSGNGSVSIYPPITLTGPYQTVDALPVDGAAITVNGAAGTLSPRGLIFHPDAFTFATADLDLPQGVDMRDRIGDKELGLSIRLIRQYDINTDRLPLRIDLLGGWATIYPELAVRMAS